MNRRLSTREIISNACKSKTAVPAFNIPYLPMMEPVIQALVDMRTFGLITVARLELAKFGAKSLSAVRAEYDKLRNDSFTRLHLDHVPVIDEDGIRVDYAYAIKEALDLGYESVMIDGSRLSLKENISATRSIVDVAARYKVPVEAELGAVLGHEPGPLPPYETLYSTGKGFTDPEEAKVFVRETGADWLSIAAGNIHGAISGTVSLNKKTTARLNIEHIRKIWDATGIPLVLHGGTGIEPRCIRDGVKNGIAKINIATAIRQPYLRFHESSGSAARTAVYEEALSQIRNVLEIEDSAAVVNRSMPE